MNTNQKLGIKVFYYYLTRNITTGIALLFVSFILFTFKSDIALKLVSIMSIKTVTLIVNYLVNGLFIISALFLIVGTIISWVKYVSCSFTLGENAFNITRGFFNKNEVSLPYRQIENINIEQSFNFKMMGVSKLYIQTAGNDNNNGKPEGVFEIIDSKIALNIREIILQRTNLEIVKDTKI